MLPIWKVYLYPLCVTDLRSIRNNCLQFSFLFMCKQAELLQLIPGIS